jgi:protein-tyrosine phosphatase
VSKPNRAQINDWLAVGACQACSESRDELIIHIYRTDTDEKQERHCTYRPGAIHFRMDYKDGRLISDAHLKELRVKVAGLKGRKRPTLVHCHAGMCRSPTVAIFLLVFVDGMHPYDAHALVTRRIYDQRAGEVCNVVYEPFKQIVRLWEAGRA